ncbi:MAG: hypothetical protein H0T73_10820 [Ardenticatenales bacterium]|nr:hypothetical protein [Ardenticatenales bacterium]
MSIFLGLLTALAVAVWAVRWYIAQGDTTLQTTLQQLIVRIRQAAPAPVAESPPLVPHEAAEHLMQPSISAEAARRAAQPLPTAEEVLEEEGKVMGYCPRCLTRREVADPSRTTTRKGKLAIRGHCAACGTGMLVFAAGEEDPDEGEPIEEQAESSQETAEAASLDTPEEPASSKDVAES